MFETKGRPHQEVYIEGKLYLAKRPSISRSSVSVLLPKDWLEAVAMGREIRYFLIDVSKMTELTVRPYFDKLPAGQERGE